MEPRYNYQPSARAKRATRQSQNQDKAAVSSNTRDKLLVQWKREGMSYKEIKAKGRFKEAESTLRGRFRALTKDPTERVRRPRWTRRDVSVADGALRRSNPLTRNQIKLLREGVEQLSEPTMTYQTLPTQLRSYASCCGSRRAAKIQRRQQVVKLRTPWKEVADFIKEGGGSYHFGNATCKKKWNELVVEDEEIQDGNIEKNDADTEDDNDRTEDEYDEED